MADDVVIGSASVQITGDYSGLEKSFTESQNLAQQAGQKISAAFDTAVSGANALTSAAATLGNTVEDLASKSGLAGGELAIFRAALQGSLESGLPVNDALKEIAASSASLGSAVSGAAQALKEEDDAAKGAKKSTDEADDSFKRVRNSAEAFEKAWADAIQENIKRSNAQFEEFANSVGNFIAHPLQSAGAAVKNFLLEIGPMGAVALGAAAALALVGKEIFNLVEASGKAAEATGNMADRLNLTWRETRNLEEMAQIAGVSINGLQQASFRLAESLEGTSANGVKVAKALADIGVVGETSGELLKGFLEKLAQIPDDTKRIALAHEVLGRSSQQILPLIKNYGELQDAITHLGPAIDDNMAKKLQASDDALDKLSISWNRFKENIAVFAAPAVQGFVDVLTAFVAGGTAPTIDKQIQDIEARMVSLGEKSALAGWLMADGFTKGKDAELELLKAQREHLVGVEQAIQRSKEYNAEIAKSNAAAKAANQPGLVQAIIDKQKELTDAVTASRAAYNTLNQAYQTGTPLASGYAVTSGDVARALSNMKAAEAAAATTKVDHVEKTKSMSAALREQSPLITEFIAGYKEVSKGILQWDQATGQLITRTDYLKMKVDEAARSMAEFYGGARDIFGVFTGLVDGPLPDFSAAATKIAPLMTDIADQVTAANQAALDTSGYKELEKALNDLGIKGLQYYKDQVDTANSAYDVIAKHGDDMYNELAQAALISAQKQIDLQLELGQITRDQYDATTKQIQADLNSLDASHEKSTQTRARHERTLGDDIQAINKKTFDSLERGLADSIVNLKGFDDLWKTLWQGLAKDLLNIMFKVLLDPLEKAIGKVLGGVFGGAGGAAGQAAGGAASAGGSAAGGASSAGGAAASGLTGILGTVFGGLTAASSIFGNFQQAQSETTLNAIEESTRYLKIGLVTQGDSLLNDSHIIRNTLTDFMKWNLDVFQTYLQNINIDLDKLTNMGGVHSSAVQSQVSTFSTNKAVVADQSTNVNVTIDTVASDITDTKVRDVFNRGIRMSKLAGAFPAGRFPQ